MSKQVIMYDEAADSCAFAPMSDDTFALVKKADGTFEPMTYNEWEALRCNQACEQVRARVAELDATPERKAQIEGFLERFRETMNIKYLEGKRSWVQVFTELFEDFEQLA